jgi:hypothetical protein
MVGQRDKHTKHIVVPAEKEKSSQADKVAQLIDVLLAYLQALRLVGHDIEIVLRSDFRSQGDLAKMASRK